MKKVRILPLFEHGSQPIAPHGVFMGRLLGKAAGGPVDIGVKPFYTSTKVTGKASLPGLQIMLTLAERFAAYARSMDYGDISSTVIHEVKRRVIDSLGCALGAYNSEPAVIARQIARSVNPSNKGATVIGTCFKTSPDMATFANGTMIRYLDYNDTYLSKEPAHPSDNISAAMAVAEAEGMSGKALITAIAIGYEVHCRLCDAASLRARGWDHVTYGAFTSAIVAAKLMGLSTDEAVHALGLAGAANIALRQTRVGELSMWKGCAFANTARNAVFAAMLARLGMTGPAPIFEGEKGFMKLVSGPLELKELEKPSKIMDTYIKFYPAEYHSQSAIEAAIGLKSEAGDIEAIDSIEVRTFDAAHEIIGSGPEKWAPKTRETADHSLPYCVAVALMDGEVGLDQFSVERINDPALHRLMQRIRIVRDPELNRLYPEAMPNQIEVKTKDGKRYSKGVIYPKGHPKNPMTDREVEDKFVRLAKGLFLTEETREMLDRLWRLDDMGDVGELMSNLIIRR